MVGATQQVEEQTGVVRLLYLPQDRLGSLVMATEKLENGSVSKAGHAAYGPYGRPVWLEAWGPNDLQNVIPYGYAGARWDDEAAPEEDTNQDGTADRQVLYLMGARWYDPELGRFLEQDPIGESGGLNLYAYVGSSPTLFVDPSGLARQGIGTRSMAGRRSPCSINVTRVSLSAGGRSGGVNTNDIFSGAQTLSLAYEANGGGLSDPNALEAENKAVMAQWKAKSTKSQGTTPPVAIGATNSNTGGATGGNPLLWQPPDFSNTPSAPPPISLAIPSQQGENNGPTPGSLIIHDYIFDTIGLPAEDLRLIKDQVKKTTLGKVEVVSGSKFPQLGDYDSAIYLMNSSHADEAIALGFSEDRVRNPDQLGIAPNRAGEGIGVVFVDRVISHADAALAQMSGANPSIFNTGPSYKQTAIGNIISHERGHLYGLSDNADLSNDIMNKTDPSFYFRQDPVLY